VVEDNYDYNITNLIISLILIMPECPLIQIGHIVSPYNEQSGTPIQASFGEPLDAEVHICPDFREGLTDLDRFTRIWLISWLDRSTSFKLRSSPTATPLKEACFPLGPPGDRIQLGFHPPN